MGVDPRQILAGFLTVTMFVMLANMIKREHFDSIKTPAAANIRLDENNVVEQSLATHPGETTGPWKEDDWQELKPCWAKPDMGSAEKSKGFVTFSLTNGPEYHVSQIADAVVVARYLGATLVVPDIRGSKPGDRRKFEEIYDVDKFMKSLDGVVRVIRDPPEELSTQNIAVVRVPNRVTEEHVEDYIAPIFRTKGSIRLATYFPSVNMKETTKSNTDPVACLGMFGTLELQPEVREVVDSMLERLRTLSRKTDGQFIAVDLRVEILERKGCLGGDGARTCYGPEDISVFLQKIGFKDATIYLTQTTWHGSLDSLKDSFPRSYIKENIMPADKKPKFLGAETSEFERVIDFYICSQSDVFIPAISGLFYANVAGKRIATGKNQILVPAIITEPTAASSDFISPYVSKKNHFAYSCFC